jgi:hypothetical protein
MADTSGLVESKRARGEGESVEDERQGWREAGRGMLCSTLCLLKSCGARFLREPVSSPLRPRHPCALVNTKQCRRALVYEVVSSRETTPEDLPERELAESPKRMLPQSEIARSMPGNLVLLSSDLRDITDCPQDCQPD